MAKIDDSVKKKVPELRFPGFTDDWEERKLGDTLTELKSGLSRMLSNNDIGLPVVRANNINDGQFNIDSDVKYWYVNDPQGANTVNYLIRKNDILINFINSEAKMGTATIVENTPIRDTIYTTNILRARLKKEYDSYYWFALTQINQYKINIKIITKPAVNQASFTTVDFKKLNFMFPNLKEQQKIGSFFKQLDDTIALHQRKLDLLKEQKKGYLQKMFPKNGAKVPELRFAGFADDWEERKLSDVANHRGGTAIEKYFDKDGVYKVISIGSYGLNSQYVDQNIRAISNEITDGRVVNSGELTMVLNDKTANGTIIGRTLLVEKDNEYVINQRTEIISPKENFDSNFAYTILNGPFREKVKRIVQGGTQIYVNYPAVSNLNLELPKIEEQQKIGSFFKQLDDTIALHQRKLDLLKEQKKGFLQKMFV